MNSYSEDQEFKVRVMKTNDNAIIPSRQSELSPGYDLYTYYDIDLEEFTSIVIDLGLIVNISKGAFGRIVSKNAYINKFQVGSEIIDSNQDINLKVYVQNQTSTKIKIKAGTKIAYLMLDRVIQVNLIEDTVFNRSLPSLHLNASLNTVESIYGDYNGFPDPFCDIGINTDSLEKQDKQTQTEVTIPLLCKCSKQNQKIIEDIQQLRTQFKYIIYVIQLTSILTGFLYFNYGQSRYTKHFCYALVTNLREE